MPYTSIAFTLDMFKTKGVKRKLNVYTVVWHKLC